MSAFAFGGGSSRAPHTEREIGWAASCCPAPRIPSSFTAPEATLTGSYRATRPCWALNKAEIGIVFDKDRIGDGERYTAMRLSIRLRT